MILPLIPDLPVNGHVPVSLTAINDYSNSPITGSFGAGSSPGDESCRFVAIFSDRDVENDETFLVELSSSDSATVSEGMAIVTIQDNDR